MVCKKAFKNRLLNCIYCFLFMVVLLCDHVVVNAEDYRIQTEDILFTASYAKLVHNGSVEYRTTEEKYYIQASYTGYGFSQFSIPTAYGNYMRGWIQVETIIELETNEYHSEYDRITIDISCDHSDIEIIDYRYNMVSDGKYRLSYFLMFNDAVSDASTFHGSVNFDMLFAPKQVSTENYPNHYDATITSKVVGFNLSSVDDLSQGFSKEAGIVKAIKSWGASIKDAITGLMNSISGSVSNVVSNIQQQTTQQHADSQSQQSAIEQQTQQQINDSAVEQQLQEEANTLQEEANETQKNIFDKIADFFDNFFSRLGDFLLGLIVPSAEELTAFLDEVNDWFGERLGFIWYPFSFAVDMVSALANGTADTGFQVPEFRLNILGTEYQIWGGMTVDLDAFGIFKYVRIFTSFLLVGGIVKLAYDKWDEWIGGHGVG